MANTLELNVEGMTCDHCVQAVTNALQEVEGVKSAKVDLEKKSATVEAENADVDAMIAAVQEEGYEASLK